MKKITLLLSVFMFICTGLLADAQKTEVWDFGAAQLDEATYNNNLTEAVINAWYSGITAGSTGKNVPATWTAGALTWTSASATSDRLRTSNTNLTRYDSSGAPTTFGNETLTGALYVNSTAAANRYFTLTANEDDEITIFVKSQNAAGSINFINQTTTGQADILASSNSGSVLKFYAQKAGNFKIYDSLDKPFYYRILRKAATYQSISGTVDITQAADIPSGYKVVFTANGKSWVCATTSNTYTAALPVGFTYSVSIQDANGYIITTAKTVEVSSSTNTFNLSLKKVDLYTVSGSISGLGTDISKLGLVFTPATSSVYVPEISIDKQAATYSVNLENGFTYTISATGINDYALTDNSLSVSGAPVTKNLSFALKSTYALTITTPGLTAEQQSKLQFVFNNLNESGYSYSFSSINGIALRNGTYSVTTSGLDEYPLKQLLTSNVTVQDAATSKAISFGKVTNWSFDDKAITTATANYKGMQFTGNISNEQSKGHLLGKSGATIKVPVAVGEKVVVTYYYAADFSIEGGTAVTTASNSTSTFETTSYTYTGTADGYVTITIGSSAATTYITDITTLKVVDFVSTIYVGADKAYKTINEALSAISNMNRTAADRVTVMIDPGNYEEMLVVSQPNVTLKNAAASPSIALKNKGVDIDENAVRITSYYGHGYNYYSMGTDQKWHADLLAVNKENGYPSYTNTGGVTTNGSYWNATVLVTASGFIASDIIFENSFNQYISLKESQDVVVEWASGSKGLRPTDAGNTAVQNKSFVERAAALAIANNADKVILNKCRVTGRQDSFYGGSGVRMVMYKGVAMGGTDYIFGPMTAVFYKTDLAMNTSEVNTDVSYITAAQQNSGRGYLMYECKITSAQPGTETASQYLSKPGYFGRPWQANTSEVVFYNTTIGTTNFPDNNGQSLILPVGWNNSLGGQSAGMYEYGTTETSGTSNAASRATWATQLTTPTLTDGTAITALNFTKGNDNWDPLAELILNDTNTGLQQPVTGNVSISLQGNTVSISGIESPTRVYVYNAVGKLQSSTNIAADSQITLPQGLWIIKVTNPENQTILKTLIP
ncbi:MAG: hypothetical protein H6Q20_2054 [Bacteroidetes bacterium]|nr:hypothetical protein [Bacteroidota bacterium]